MSYIRITWGAHQTHRTLSSPQIAWGSVFQQAYWRFFCALKFESFWAETGLLQELFRLVSLSLFFFLKAALSLVWNSHESCLS